nr:caspase family protein [uncultured Roseibium sp.]
MNLISPEPEATIVGDGSGSGAVDVEVEIEATSGGIGKVEWSVNGVLQDLSERALSPLVLADGVEEAGGVSTVGETKRVTQSLYLAPGENEIQVVAYNAAGLIASDPLTFTLTLDEPEITDPKLYVLSVGVNDYFDSRLDLAYAASDAKAIGSALKVAGKEIYSDIIVETVLDEDVTKEGLEAAFERLETKVRPGDVFVFFLAGHGKTEDGRYYFLPHDFRYQDEGSFKTAGIGQEVMQEWFSKIRAQKSVLLFDTCESGTLTQEPVQRGTEALAAISRLNRAIGRTTLTASTDTAPALEGFRGHGLFTYTLLDAIAAADNDNDSAVDVTELASYLDRRLPEYSEAAFGYTQVPQMKVVGNTFPIAKATLVLSDEPAEIIPTTPTHVVIQPTNILAEAVNEATVVMELKPGAAVRLISSEDGWSLIARDGKELGYLAATSLLAIQ